jgi:mono/diheme cytochrome c family protein
MNARLLSLSLLTCTLLLAGCKNIPGKPKLGAETERPEQVADFATLYKQNCVACHGDNGRNGAAISLANPVYLATAGAANLQRVTAAGVPGTMMPPFAKTAGGMLTDQQIAILAHGMISAWGDASALTGQTPPSYTSIGHGDSANGQKVFAAACARCHGTDGNGQIAGKTHLGSLIDPAYLALISDQALRSILIAGMPELGMPDWRSELTGPGAHPLSEQDITDTVAWLTSHRTATPGQPYQQHP